MRMSVLLASAVLAVAAPANAASVLFSQNFDSLPEGIPAAGVPGFTVTGTVDVVANGNYSITCAGNTGACLDLDGTPGPGQLLSNAINFSAGQQILVSFDVSGNQRGGADDQFNFELLFGQTTTRNVNILSGFAFGSTGVFTNASSGVYGETIGSSRPFLTYTLGFIPTISGTMQLRFAHGGADFIGPVLDNVLVTQTGVPEPQSWAMLIAGFGLVGAARRSRRRALTA